jgi:hypothetical protein
MPYVIIHSDALLDAHAAEVNRRFGSTRNLTIGWAHSEHSISTKNYDTREILTTRLRRGRIIHRVEDY